VCVVGLLQGPPQRNASWEILQYSPMGIQGGCFSLSMCQVIGQA